MKRFPLFVWTAGLTIALLAAGCAQDDAQAPASRTEVATAADTVGFNFQGDFDGPLGVQLWSVREAMRTDVPGTLAKIYDMGFREVELAGTYGMTPERFRQVLDSVGLEATSMHVGYNLMRDSLQMVLDQAEALGVQYIGVASIPYPRGERWTDEMAREAAADFNAWGQAARERGIQFFYHNHGFEFQPNPDGSTPFDVLVQETDPENVKFEMDVLWTALPGQDPAALLRKYPDRWELMHVKDLKQGIPTNDHSGRADAEDEVPVGTGQIDYQAVLEAAEEIGLDKYYIEDETTDPLGNMPKSIQFMETVTYGEAP